MRSETLLPSQLSCILDDTDLMCGWGPASLVFHGRARCLLSGLGKAFSCQVMPTVGCRHGVKPCSWCEGRAGDTQKAGGMSLSILRML